MLTNCVNCVAPIDPKLDKCPYCGTSYEAMGVEKNDAACEIKLTPFVLRASNVERLVRDGLMTTNEARRVMGLYGI